ncbi:ABC transporter ATP-binding protein [Winogradskya humida]|uniref:Multidrug ABC transporter ATP-binding protein n=1 Tax=Winogradskya humida TaxID=113566 RepID=A0ABQ4A5K4_9ACTN|nr:ABC transporter ATP-binding protein [Actinoplanes humidus]GIE26127.1 multidrug ABC transporter ATP-binding protein [Actinoplanes humidus]
MKSRRARKAQTSKGWSALTRLLRRYIRPYYRALSAVVVLMAAQAAGNLYLPNLNADIIDDGVVGGDLGYIWRAGALMLVITAGLGIVAVLAVYLASRVSMTVGADLRAAIFARVQSFSVADLHRFGVSSLTTRTVNDVQQLQVFLQLSLTLLISVVFTIGGALILAVRAGRELSLLLVVALPVLVAIIAVTLVVLLPLFRAVQVKTDRLNQVLREQISGVRVTRAFGRTDAERVRFGAVNEDITATGLRANRVFALVLPVIFGIVNVSSVGVVWFGGRLVSDGTMEIGSMTAFLIYILQILTYIVVAVTVIVLIPRAAAAANRIEQILTVMPSSAGPPRAAPASTQAGKVEFQQVSFRYPGSERPVVSDLTLTFRPGQTSAVIGGTGSGKTTLLNLIPRFIDATDGTVLVHGLGVPEQSVDDLRASIGLVPQTALLFAGTVAGNLRFGRPEATDDELWRALETAQARDFVAALPGGLDAPVERGGANLSGGQRQRLSIARALVRRPWLYLFDDCFSALDAATDARLRAELRAETRGATVVIVAQRASTIMHADQIVVLESGRIAGVGTHERLLTGCRAYQEIIASQLGEGAAA